MKRYGCCAVLFVLGILVSGAGAGELKKDYFGATKPGMWVEQVLTSPDGSKSTFTTHRLPDDDGHAVLEVTVKIVAGPGAGTESKSTYVMPKDFNLARDFLSYGTSTEKMTMEFSGMKMPVAEATLDAIRKGSKNYRNAVTFEGKESVDGHACDRYGYSVTIAGPAPSKEVGELWLDPSVPFGVVRQTAKSLKADGTVESEYELKLTDSGAVETEMASAAPPVAAGEAPAPEAPPVVGLVDGYKAGRIAIDVSVVAGSAGRKLELVLRNKTDAEITVNLPAGELEIPGSMPVETLRVVFGKAASVVLPAGPGSGSVSVEQRGKRGPIEGTFTLSFYEGTPLYSGSVTMGSLPR